MTEIREDYTEAEIARLAKNSKKERWIVTIVLEDGKLHSTKWYTAKKNALKEALGFLHETGRKTSDVTMYMSNQAEFNEEISTL